MSTRRVVLVALIVLAFVLLANHVLGADKIDDTGCPTSAHSTSSFDCSQ